jgi:hypothetical protein
MGPRRGDVGGGAIDLSLARFGEGAQWTGREAALPPQGAAVRELAQDEQSGSHRARMAAAAGAGRTRPRAVKPSCQGDFSAKRSNHVIPLALPHSVITLTRLLITGETLRPVSCRRRSHLGQGA